MDYIRFKVNGVKHKVGSDVSSDVSLVLYLRNYLNLRGTKYMCLEGGCGACIVTASKYPGAPYIAVNSCLVAITSCDGWDIRTIEGLGNRIDGYHTLQKTMAENHGSQCGYCTPGWIMAMYGLQESKKSLTMLEVERSFGSNICRCTGYRPILKTFKTCATDAPKESRITDIENLQICKKSRRQCNTSACDDGDDWCVVRKDDLHDDHVKRITLKDGKIWFKPRVLQDVFNILREEGIESYMLVAGNTAKGALPKDDYPNILIDISTLQELKTITYDQNLVVGAGTTLSDFLDILKEASTKEYFGYLSKIHFHIDWVAHIPVRNLGTIAGNLMIKHENQSFPSDIFLLLAAVDARLTIVDIYGNTQKITMEDFLKTKMAGNLILNVMLPPLSDEHKFFSYKLMPRAQSAHAIVNIGCLYKVNANNVVERARIVINGLSSSFLRATATEAYLVGKNLFKNETLQGALQVLDGEMVVTENPPEPSAAYRRYVAKALLYKGLLTLCPPNVRHPRFESGAIHLHGSRPVSNAQQIYTTDPKMWPLNQPIPKAEGLIQCAGEAQYTEDIPTLPNEVFATFVLSTVLGTIVKIDATDALAYPGVIAFYTANDIPGSNSFTPADSPFYTVNEEVLCSGDLKCCHYPIGIIVAETRHIADRAAKLVKVTYNNVRKPVVDIKVAKTDPTRNTLFTSIDATNTGTDVYKTITGSTTIYGQYHFAMETLVCVAKPTEEGIEMHGAIQWPDATHVMVSRALNMDENKIDCHVRRLGGGFGIKISRSIQSAVACCLAVLKLNRPCRLIQSLNMNLKAVGKRFPCSNDYEIAVNKSGVIQRLDTTIYEDNGYTINETVSVLGVDVYNNCYDATKINYKVYDTCTDTTKNTFCRAPGTLESIAFMELIMERISYELCLDPVAVRLANLDRTKYNELVEMVDTLKEKAEFNTRRASVDSFNTQNRWKKRGLRWAFVRWTPTGAQRFDVNVSALQGDGTVVITHAGVEMGQGINTKAAQVAAHFLKIPVEKIQIKGNNTVIAPNSFFTGGSLTTTSVIIGLRRCCDELNARLEPVRATLTNPTWEEVVKAAYNADVDLQVHGFAGFTDAQVYHVWGMTLCEVEIDVLTGESEILRVDMLQDVGLSINPEIDVGQVEGGFVMGQGYWTCENLQYGECGSILTDTTWHYHVPQARDIPQDFRVYLKKNSYSNDRILGSKATGEPAICAAVAVPIAIREAIVQARQEGGIPTTEWFDIDGPSSTENICMAINTNTKDFKFY